MAWESMVVGGGGGPRKAAPRALGLPCGDTLGAEVGFDFQAGSGSCVVDGRGSSDHDSTLPMVT